MIVLLLLLALFAVLILWIVFMPAYLKINTDLNQYEFRQSGTLTISFHPWQKPLMEMRLFGFRIGMTKKGARTSREIKKRKWKMKRSPAAWFYLQRGVFRSFRLKKFICTVDLDDVVMNARLIPLIRPFNRGVVSVTTNFIDRNFLCLEIECRINRLLWTCLRFFTKK